MKTSGETEKLQRTCLTLNEPVIYLSIRTLPFIAEQKTKGQQQINTQLIYLCVFVLFRDSFEDWSEAQKITSALLVGRSYENLIDFDNHLDDLRNDWTNPVINKSVLDLC